MTEPRGIRELIDVDGWPRWRDVAVYQDPANTPRGYANLFTDVLVVHCQTDLIERLVVWDAMSRVRIVEELAKLTPAFVIRAVQ